MKSHQSRKTNYIEAVETHNLTLSFRRLYESNGDTAWRRALYHALAISGTPGFNELKQIREALRLP